MFRDHIRDTQFVRHDAEVSLNFIKLKNPLRYEVNNIDLSLLSTMRALLGKRLMPTEENININITSYVLAPQPLDHDRDYGENNLAIFNMEGDSAYEAQLSYIREHWTEYVEQPKVNAFFKKTFRVSCFLRERTHSAVVVTCGMGLREFHYLQCAIPVILPWFFKGENNELTESEMELIKSLRGTSTQDYLDILDKIADTYDFKGMKTRRILGDFETKIEKAKIGVIERQISDLREDIISYNNGIATNLAAIREYEIMLLGLKNKATDESEGELMDYFLVNDSIEVVGCNGDGFTFIAKGNCENFDADILEDMLDNPNSFINKHPSTSVLTSNDVATLLREIFINQTMKFRFCARYHFDSYRVSGDSVRNDDFKDWRYYYPNPHIQRFKCLGGYSSLINEALQNRDYISAVEQCVASCKSLNFADSVVISDFLTGIHNSAEGITEMRAIELPNGEIVTPLEAVKYIHDNENKEE